jgi:hypothetical protein
MKTINFGCAMAVVALSTAIPAHADGQRGSGQIRTNQVEGQAQPTNPGQSTHTKGRVGGINTVPPRPRPQANQAPGGVNVASGDVTGDGRPAAALLLPAVQKARVTNSAAEQAPAQPQAKPKPKKVLGGRTSSQGPYQ